MSGQGIIQLADELLAERVCPFCQASQIRAYRFCHSCGQDLQKCHACKRGLPSKMNCKFCPHWVPHSTRASLNKAEKEKEAGANAQGAGE